MPPVEGWPSASVLLAWDEVRRTARDLRDNRNEVMHEFARQLDLEDGERDGRPVLWEQGQHTAWGRVMSGDFLREGVGVTGVLGREFAAGDPGEVFAAATELFFERPEVLRERHGELYGLLVHFYQLDPARWMLR